MIAAPVFPCNERFSKHAICALDRGHDGRHLSGQTPTGREAGFRRMAEGLPPPEDAARLQGPEVGARCIWHGKQGDEVVTIKARSYVWAPDKQREDGYWGYRRYDLKVIQREVGSLLVDDKDLEALS